MVGGRGGRSLLFFFSSFPRWHPASAHRNISFFFFPPDRESSSPIPPANVIFFCSLRPLVSGQTGQTVHLPELCRATVKSRDKAREHRSLRESRTALPVTKPSCRKTKRKTLRVMTLISRLYDFTAVFRLLAATSSLAARSNDTAKQSVFSASGHFQNTRNTRRAQKTRKKNKRSKQKTRRTPDCRTPLQCSIQSARLDNPSVQLPVSTVW